jgi:hypothetical protein
VYVAWFSNTLPTSYQSTADENLIFRRYKKLLAKSRYEKASLNRKSLYLIKYLHTKVAIGLQVRVAIWIITLCFY